ncbi:myosin heavy chain, clone 203-like protein [Gossypium australe]|uniref:Myosin heavy chain, clone 203-like protein n=1 Tax=Gossypium australe TaxID=47621 RepID=A0A5B6X2U6_9ROSI|nr:myosin heavy chain, clone 203-like protein [Gossypium australe]
MDIQKKIYLLVVVVGGPPSNLKGLRTLRVRRGPCRGLGNQKSDFDWVSRDLKSRSRLYAQRGFERPPEVAVVVANDRWPRWSHDNPMYDVVLGLTFKRPKRRRFDPDPTIRTEPLQDPRVFKGKFTLVQFSPPDPLINPPGMTRLVMEKGFLDQMEDNAAMQIWSGKSLSEEQVRDRNHVMSEALAQVREIVDHLQTLTVQADILSLEYESESDQSRELAWLLGKYEVLSVKAKSSPDINDMSDTAANSKPPFDQEMCLGEPRDFEDV